MCKHNEKYTLIFWKCPGDLALLKVNDTVEDSIVSNDKNETKPESWNKLQSCY